MHILCYHRIFYLHPKLSRASYCRTTHLHKEEVFRMTTTPHIHQLEHDSSCIRVQLDKVDCLFSQTEPVYANQVLGLAKTFRPNFYLPDLLEGRTRGWYSIVSPISTVTDCFTCRERENKTCQYNYKQSGKCSNPPYKLKVSTT